VCLGMFVSVLFLTMVESESIKGRNEDTSEGFALALVLAASGTGGGKEPGSVVLGNMLRGVMDEGAIGGDGPASPGKAGTVGPVASGKAGIVGPAAGDTGATADTDIGNPVVESMASFSVMFRSVTFGVSPIKTIPPNLAPA